MHANDQTTPVATADTLRYYETDIALVRPDVPSAGKNQDRVLRQRNSAQTSSPPGPPPACRVLDFLDGTLRHDRIVHGTQLQIKSRVEKVQTLSASASHGFGSALLLKPALHASSRDASGTRPPATSRSRQNCVMLNSVAQSQAAIPPNRPSAPSKDAAWTKTTPPRGDKLREDVSHSADRSEPGS